MNVGDKDPFDRLQSDGAPTTAEVGSEGGSPGDVEVVHDTVPLTGSEAGETATPHPGGSKTIKRDETGRGRRSP
jgi:hypothetical protein